MSKETLEVLTNSARWRSARTRWGTSAYSRTSRPRLGRANCSGDIALAVFNLAGEARAVKLAWSALSLQKAPRSLCDLWRHKDLPQAGEQFSASIAGHGVAMLRVGP